MTINNVTRISNHIEKVEEFISSEPDPIESAKLMVMMNMMYEQKDMAEMQKSIVEMIVENKDALTSQITELTKKSVEHDKVVVQVKVVITLLLLTSGGLYNLTSKYIDIIDMLRIDQQMLVKDIKTLKESVGLK